MQYGQRKLHRSVTEMRRSRNGRPSVSRVPAPGSAATLSVVTLIGARLPAIQPGDEPFAETGRTRWQLDKAIGVRQRAEITGAVGRAGRGPRAAPVIMADLDRHKPGQL